MFSRLLLASLSATVARAHLAAWHKGMYALNGVSGSVDYNSDDVVTPLWQLPKDQWWFHAINNVPNFPPADGDYLELPAGKSFTVEIASNRGETTLSFDGQFASDWPDGQTYPADYNVPTCITSPNMHTQNQSQAAGTAFAISYNSDITKVTPDNLVVFSVRYHTPWLRVTSYDVPADMPACPEGGCICSWGWIPNGCGEPNMYHLPYRCMVTGATGTKAVGTPKPPVWCEDDPSSCVTGPKQMLYWNQLDGNNIEVSGYDLAGEARSPAYNSKCGFDDGAQNDIFTGSSISNSGSSGSSSSGSSSGSSSTKTTTVPSSSPTTTNAAPKETATSSSTVNSASASASASATSQCKSRKVRRAEARKKRATTMHRRRSAHVY